MADEEFILTRDGEQSLREQLQAAQAEIARLRDLLGDLHDDPGGNLDGEDAGVFQELRTDLDRTLERAGHLQFVLERAVVQHEDPNPRRVDPGERVVVWDFMERRERSFDLRSSPEVAMTYTNDATHRQVSIDSPVGQALVGRRVGDIVEVEVPDGKTRFAIRRIERQ